MAELWIPKFEEMYDASNAYDMMLLFQEELDKASDPDNTDSWYPLAKGALRALSIAIEKMSFEEKQICLATDLAVVTSTDRAETFLTVENVGLRGSIDDVHCMKLGKTVGPSIALGIDVEAMFVITNPDDSDLMLTTAVAPISKIHYIEQVAA